MTDKERLEKIREIAGRGVIDNLPKSVLRHNMALIVALSSASDEFLERNAAQFEGGAGGVGSVLYVMGWGKQ